MHTRLIPARRIVAILCAGFLGCSLLASAVRSPEDHARSFNELLTGSPAAAPTAQASIDFLDHLVKAGRAELERPDANPADIGAVAATLGDKPADLFAFVRDRVATEPYAGLLRGGAGALACRAGNSVDKSLLLAELLRARGFECRLMRGTLDAARAAKIIDVFLAGKSAQPPAASDALDRLAAATGLAPERVRHTIDTLAATARDDCADLDKTAAGQAGWIRAQLAAADIRLGQTHDARREQLAQTLAEHVWVQAKVAADPERWLDLDPSLPGAEPGTVGVEDGAPLDGDPAERHALQFKLVYVRTVAGESEEKALIDVTVAAERGLTEHGLFVIQPADPLPSFTAMAQFTPEESAAYWRNVKNYRAQLQFGAETTSSDSFDLAGNITTAPDGSPGSLAAGFGVFGFDGDEEPPAKDTAFVELVAVFTLTGPGAPARPQRRVLLSAADLGGKSVATPALVWQLLLQPGQFPQEVANYAGLRHQIAALEPMVALLKAREIAASDIDQMAGEADFTFAGIPVQLARMREEAVARSLRAHPGLVAYFPAPQLTLFEQRICANSGAPGCGRSRIDIVENGVTFAPRNATGEEAAALATLEQGVFDTLVEARLLARATGSPTIDTPIDVFEKSRQTRARLTALAATEDNLPLPAEDRAWIATCEPPGRFILTAAGDATAWWSLDPRTGTILGRAHGGGGQAATEDALKRASTVKVSLGALKCAGSAAYAAGKSVYKDGKMTQATGVGLGFSLMMCTFNMGMGAASLDYSKTAVFGFLNWIVPQVINEAKGALSK